MPSVVMLNVVMPSVVAPTHSLTRRVRLMFQIVWLAWACLLFQIVNHGTLTEMGGHSTVDLLVLTSLD